MTVPSCIQNFDRGRPGQFANQLLLCVLNARASRNKVYEDNNASNIKKVRGNDPPNSEILNQLEKVSRGDKRKKRMGTHYIAQDVIASPSC